MLPDNILTTINVESSDLFPEIKKNKKPKKAKVDIYIAKAIQLLNDKGYKTICCCSGHIKHLLKDCNDPRRMSGYVWFKCDIPSAPNGWYIDKHKMPTGGDTIRYDSYKRSKKCLFKKMNKLMRWAKQLPDIS